MLLWQLRWPLLWFWRYDPCGNPVEKAEAVTATAFRNSWLERYPSELSSGELQRICLARALGPGLRFLLCDESSAMLDLITQAQLWSFLLSQAEERNLGLLVVSHRPAAGTGWFCPARWGRPAQSAPRRTG